MNAQCDTRLADALLRDGRQSATALAVRRGVCRHLADQGLYALPELVLPNGRRADLMALCPKGRLTIIEIKSSLADYRADDKWPAYLDFCDSFYFACPPEMDAAVFPEEVGLIVADAYAGEVLRPSPAFSLPPARRRVLTLSLARLAAQRLLSVNDPEGFGHLNTVLKA